MRKLFFQLFAASLVVVFITGSCSSKGGGGGGGTTEANLVVTLNPPVGSNQPAAPQTDFPLTVSITSTMPPQGVTIDVSVKKDDGSGAAPFFTESRSSTIANNNFTITGTPVGVVCLTTVTVTSKSKPSNTWTGSYRYSRKS
jgi:hypothetical protein